MFGSVDLHLGVQRRQGVALLLIGELVDARGDALAPGPNVADPDLSGLPRSLTRDDFRPFLLQARAPGVECRELVGNQGRHTAAELARHAPGLAPNIRLLRLHAIGANLDEFGACCTPETGYEL